MDSFFHEMPLSRFFKLKFAYFDFIFSLFGSNFQEIYAFIKCFESVNLFVIPLA